MKMMIHALFILLAFSLAPVAYSESEGGSGGVGANYKEITPPFVVNLPDPHQTHFMQIIVAVSSDNELALKAIDEHAPLIRNNLIMLFTSQEKDIIKTKEGREKLRVAAQAVVNKALAQVGAPPVNALYFTSLVVQ